MKGDTNAIKPAELIHPHAEILKEALIFDAMYLQKCIEYAGGELHGSNKNNKLDKVLLSFMIIDLKEPIPNIIKSLTQTKTEVY